MIKAKTYSREQIAAMSDDELRLEIAQAKGYEYRQNAPKGHFCLTVGNDQGWWKVPGQKGWTCAQCHEVLPDWPGDIAAAWELVEGEAAYFTLTRTNDTHWPPAPFGEVHWECRFFAPQSGEVQAATAPRAICEAWLMRYLGNLRREWK